MKYKAEIMLAMIKAKAMGTSMCMKPAEAQESESKGLIIAPHAVTHLVRMQAERVR
jgi:hypothetical protein